MLLCMILKVIGLVLLFLLLLLLLLLGLVLLVPFRYAGAGHKGEEKRDYAARVDVSWFLHLVQLHAGLTPAGLACDLRILWFHPMDSRPPDTPPDIDPDENSSQSKEKPSTEGSAAHASDENSSQSEEEPSTEGSAAHASDENSSQSEEKPSTEGSAAHASDETLSRGEKAMSSDEAVVHSSDEASSRSEETTVPDDTVVKDSNEAPSENEEHTPSDETDEPSPDETDQEKETKSPSPAAEAPKKKKRKKSSFADRIKRICEKASSLREAVEDEENQKAFHLLISRVKYLLHHLRFRKFEGRLKFGFDDPAMMGRILGVLSLFYPLYGESFTLTPVFDHTVFEGEITLKGHVRLIHILIAGIQLMMNKKIRGLVLDRI